MEDIFHWCREGNAMQVRVWLDDTEHDMNQGYANGSSLPLAIYGQTRLNNFPRSMSPLSHSISSHSLHSHFIFTSIFDRQSFLPYSIII